MMIAADYARVLDDGLAFWLDVHVDERYRDYRFSSKDPGA